MYDDIKKDRLKGKIRQVHAKHIRCKTKETLCALKKTEVLHAFSSGGRHKVPQVS
jgi:hypothetical protein